MAKGSRPPPAGPIEDASDRLDSWKDVAAYLPRDVSTVQRWEKREGMPVHRHVHEKPGTVYAFRSELDAWWRGRGSKLAQQDVRVTNGTPASVPTEPRETNSSTGVPGLFARDPDLAPIRSDPLFLAFLAELQKSSTALRKTLFPDRP